MKRLIFLSCLGLISCKTLVVHDVSNQQEKPPLPITSPKDPLPAPLLDHKVDFDVNQIAVEEEIPQLNLWEYLATKQSLAKTNHPRVESFIEEYLKQPYYLNIRAEKAAPYLFYIITELEKRNMPVELAFTPMVESNFDPLAHSVVQAAGLWQFMPRTAKGFGLTIDEWYDGRRDVVSSTKAALDYYQYLNRMFDGDWLLTVAAFNFGEGNILKAIRKNKRNGLATDYWSLKLPRETTRHIPKWLALSNIFLNSSSYQVALPPIANEAVFTQVEVNAPANLMQLAKIAHIDKDVFYRLNPAYNRLFIPQHHKKATLLIPIAHLDLFQDGLMNIDTHALMASVSYQVKPGDNLSSIAQKNNTSVKTLKDLNGLSNDHLNIGQTLKMPGYVNATEHEKSFFATLNKNQQRRRYQTYKVKSGDSLWTIAKKFNVSTNQLISWNGMHKDSVLRIGHTLKVWPNGHNSYASNKTTYEVKSGDSLYTIAKKFKVKVDQITTWNSLSKKALIKPGQLLTIYR